MKEIASQVYHQSVIAIGLTDPIEAEEKKQERKPCANLNHIPSHPIRSEVVIRTREPLFLPLSLVVLLYRLDNFGDFGVQDI